jgi:hypothetical protein
MFSKFLFFLALIALCALWSCSPAEEFPSKYKGQQIHFGQGGGFSGIVTYFALLEDGRLFQRALRDSTFNLVDRWEKPIVSQMFTNYKVLGLDDVQYYEPGDIYYFIQHKTGNGPFHKIAWGKPGLKADENVVTYYNLLFKSTKPKS